LTLPASPPKAKMVEGQVILVDPKGKQILAVVVESCSNLTSDKIVVTEPVRDHLAVSPAAARGERPRRGAS
jgi:hypothetical protein